MSLEGLISAVLPSLLVGLMLALWEARLGRRLQQDEQQAESELMRIELEVATAQLSYAVAMAVKRGTPNGEMETAMAAYTRAMGKFRAFERRQMARGERRSA